MINILFILINRENLISTKSTTKVQYFYPLGE